MSDARTNILQRLRNNRPDTATPERSPVAEQGWSTEEMIERFTARQQAVRGEVHRLADGDWLGWLRSELPKRQLSKVLVGKDHARMLPGMSELTKMADIDLSVYDQAIEQWKPALFSDIDVAITHCHAAIAETGSLVLWPDANEPRLMSLVPPVHIALLKAQQLHETFTSLLQAQGWNRQDRGGMPTNSLLISGPSKTADIEQTLAYGIHGPKQLITLILG